MNTQEVSDVVNNADVPPPSFWENELELGLRYINARVEQDGTIEEWITQRTGRQINILCKNIGIDEGSSVRAQKQLLHSYKDELKPYYLVSRFAMNKSKVATNDFAKGVLDEETLEGCRIKEDEFDKTALLFAIYFQDWSDLRLIFHLDKIHKSGFARMKLNDKIRRPVQQFREFIQPKAVEKILADFDKSKRDGRTSEFKNVIVHDGRFLVFIRRAERPDLILQEGKVAHGYRPEWIILAFEENAKRVDISSVSISIPLEIANRIASGYFGKTCEYANESEITYKKQIERFLNQIVNGGSEDLPLVEIAVANSPLKGSPKLKVSKSDSNSIGDSIEHFEQGIGTILGEIEHIESIKVHYEKARVSLFFEKEAEKEDEFVVRYSDHRLNAFKRRKFEAHMRNVYGIPVLSTEKRHKQQSAGI